MKLQLSNGEQAVLCALENERVVLQSPEAAAPGQRVQFGLAGGMTLLVKTYRCVRQDEAAYRIEGRAINLSRALRQKLEAALALDPTAG